MILRPTALRYDPPRSVIAIRDRLIAETFDRSAAGSSLNAPVSGTLYMAAIPLMAGQICTSLSFASAGIGATVPTNWWMALYDRNLALLASTADQLTAAIGASTVFTLALGTPYTVPVTDSYYFGLMVAATTPPRLIIQTMNSTAISAFNHILAATSSTGLTTTPPNPAGALTAITSCLWGAVT